MIIDLSLKPLRLAEKIAGVIGHSNARMGGIPNCATEWNETAESPPMLTPEYEKENEQ